MERDGQFQPDNVTEEDKTFFANSSEEVREQFPLEKLWFGKERSERSSNRLSAERGGKRGQIVLLLQSGITDVGEISARVKKSRAYTHRVLWRLEKRREAVVKEDQKNRENDLPLIEDN